MLLRLLATLGLLAGPVLAQANESCDAFGDIASNYANSAYQLASAEPELVDSQGLFDTWVMFLGTLLERSETNGSQTKEFFAASKMAGSLIVENKQATTAKVSPEDYAPLFSRMVVRICKDGRSTTPTQAPR